MSTTQAKAFLERLENDQGFMDKVSACKDQQARLELVKAEGFDFTADDLLRVRAEQTPNPEVKLLIEKKLAGELDEDSLREKLNNLELTEEELASVAGGVNWLDPSSCAGWGCDILYCY